VMKGIVVFWLALLFLSGCNSVQNDTNTTDTKPYILNTSTPYALKEQKAQEQELQQKALDVEVIKVESAQEIAKINMQRDIAIEKIKAESLLEQQKLQQQIALNEHSIATKKEDNDLYIHKYYVVATLLGFFVVAALLFLLYRNYNKTKMQIHKDNLEKERAFHEDELKLRLAEKMLDTIASENINEDDKQDLIRTLKNETKLISKS
jgi:large-conductance mechanosensitive channel/uncharacterized protein YceK